MNEFNEVNENEKPENTPKNEIDNELSSELDKSYSAYMEDGKSRQFEKKETPEDKTGELTETDRAKLKEETG